MPMKKLLSKRVAEENSIHQEPSLTVSTLTSTSTSTTSTPTINTHPDESTMSANSTSATKKPRLNSDSTSTSSTSPLLRESTIKTLHNRANTNHEPIFGGMLILCAASEQRSRQLDENRSCSCPRSRCIKLYCECFQEGKICSIKCVCKKCKNTVMESGPNGARTKAIQSILSRNPYAFRKDKPVPSEGEDVGVVCRCVKSQCLKLYCECFQGGMVCGKFCMCMNCLNTEEESGVGGRRTSARDSCLERKPHAFSKKEKQVGSGCNCKNSR
jgi:hypothetical protein